MSRTVAVIITPLGSIKKEVGHKMYVFRNLPSGNCLYVELHK